jgi:hypothetical protein
MYCISFTGTQINDLKIQNALRKDDKPAAAKLAIKMLVEDEYIIDTVIMVGSLNCVVENFKHVAPTNFCPCARVFVIAHRIVSLRSTSTMTYTGIQCRCRIWHKESSEKPEEGQWILCGRPRMSYFVWTTVGVWPGKE